MNKKIISNSNYVLRKVLNSEDNLYIVKNFIESILKIKIKKIKLNPYLYKKRKSLPNEENFGIVDVRIKQEDEQEINVGIQIIDGSYVSTKMFLYTSQIHSNQIDYDDYRKIVKTITINILDFNYSNQEKYHNQIYLNNNDYIKNFFEMHIIELPKFILRNNKIESNEEAWISYLKGENIDKAINKNQIIRKLDKLLIEYWENEVMV